MGTSLKDPLIKLGGISQTLSKLITGHQSSWAKNRRELTNAIPGSGRERYVGKRILCFDVLHQKAVRVKFKGIRPNVWVPVKGDGAA